MKNIRVSKLAVITLIGQMAASSHPAIIATSLAALLVKQGKGMMVTGMPSKIDGRRGLGYKKAK
jgi:hypothetical protein